MQDGMKRYRCTILRGPVCRWLMLASLLAFTRLLPAQSPPPSESPSAAVTASPASQEWYQESFWTTLNGQPATQSWEFADQEIRLVNPRGGSGSLISPPLPPHFELSWQWKIAPKTNSGLKYRVRQFDRRWLGIEYQMIDEPIPLDRDEYDGSTASIYELQAPQESKPLKPAGEWNQARVVASADRVEHYLNGVLVAATATRGPAWEARLARSKFYGAEEFGQPQAGDRIMLTDHGGTAAFKDFHFVALRESASESLPATEAPPQLGNGLRNSWADQHSIVIWTRTTQRSDMLLEGPDFKSLPRDQVAALSKSNDVEQLTRVQMPEGTQLDQMFGACPGAAGEVRLTYFPVDRRKNARTTEWKKTEAASDFAAQWKLEELQPATEYAVIAEARPLGAEELTSVVRGRFKTAPPNDLSAEVRFCMTTCHDFVRRDDGLAGHKIYTPLTDLNPDFVVHAGDIEYYDHEKPWGWTIELMRFKWARIFSLPKNREFYTNHSTYFIKDDHDTLKDDSWAGQRYGAVSFEEGVQLFNQEQFPSRDPRYATIPWGRDLQIWILEGRDYRSPNTMPDGPEKTILGTEQKAWLKQTLQESSATFKLVFSPTPIVGPDRQNKRDNHANDNFQHEGQELREFFSGIPNLIVFCGDRHWQYASVDEQTGLWEFGCGPGSERHQLGWKEGDVRPEHRFLRVQGGFLSGRLTLDAEQPRLVLRHHTVTGEQVREFPFTPPER